MDKKIFYLIGLSALILLPGISFAQGDLITPILCTFAKNLWATAVAGGVIAWAVVVILFVTSIGSPERVNLAKKGLMVVLIGTVIVIIGSSALTMVGKAIGLTRGEGDVCKGIGGTEYKSSTEPDYKPGTEPSPQQNNPGTPSSDTNNSQPMDWNKLWKPSDDN